MFSEQYKSQNYLDMIELIPFAGRKHINVLEEGYAGSEMLPLPPANVAKARTLIGTLTLAGAVCRAERLRSRGRSSGNGGDEK